MKKRIFWFLIIAAVLAFLYATNPTEGDFMNYVDKQIKVTRDKSEDSLKKFLVGLDEEAQKMATEGGATRTNCYIFSIFRVEDKEGGHVHKVIGFATRVFFPLNPGPKDEPPNIY